MTPEEVNFRPAVSPQESCQSCPNFQGPGVPCLQGLPADPAAVCDAFGAPAQDAGPMPEGAAAGVPPDIMAQLFGGAG